MNTQSILRNKTDQLNERAEEVLTRLPKGTNVTPETLDFIIQKLAKFPKPSPVVNEAIAALAHKKCQEVK